MLVSQGNTDIRIWFNKQVQIHPLLESSKVALSLYLIFSDVKGFETCLRAKVLNKP